MRGLGACGRPRGRPLATIPARARVGAAGLGSEPGRRYAGALLWRLFVLLGASSWLTEINDFSDLAWIGGVLRFAWGGLAAYPQGELRCGRIRSNCRKLELTVLGVGPITRLKNAGGTAAGERKTRLWVLLFWCLTIHRLVDR